MGLKNGFCGEFGGVTLFCVYQVPNEAERAQNGPENYPGVGEGFVVEIEERNDGGGEENEPAKHNGEYPEYELDGEFVELV